MKQAGKKTELLYNSISYFPGLNGLRFIAAYLVVMHHSETIRNKYGLLNLQSYSLFRNGSTAVSFFFVLSGFLITYLLLKEYKKKKDISIKHFYVRRVLRIWPLYFLIVIAGGLLIPFIIQKAGIPYKMPYTFSEIWYYYVFFLPFVVNLKFGHHLLEPLWSIGVEELFYLIWAPLVKFIYTYLPFVLIGIIVLKEFLVLSDVFVNYPLISGSINMLQFDAMAIGGLGAYLLFYSSRKISSLFLFNPFFQILFFAILALRIFAHTYMSESIFSGVYNILFNTPAFSALFLYSLYLWLIISISVNDRSLLRLDNKISNLLGDISYGVYMYHMLVVFTLILVLKKYLAGLDIWSASILYYSVVSLGVLLISYLSKRYFEDQFLKLKSKFN
jgi:peptidoglycan/LPS O-acetylase OafA/YrhL